ncbi:hypothetical protein OUZ56_026091 [Daphnia magna]|uniref:Uncharacterized protein n=1 Tax=Daphnia magna TaxID=35525 RepID=A0ABQ9ZKT0_9CRUS|nr:hypothetical protein OUZ56_026091 [Daphnia magna]
MSDSSQESSASVLHKRALFSAINRCPSLDSRVSTGTLEITNNEVITEAAQEPHVLRPLLHSWSLQPSGSPASAGIESALRLLGAAFANVSKLQRANFMRNVASKLAPLLKDPRVFPSREYKRLFGSKFIEAMVKEVEDDA